ncbi:hypothetical protein PSHT_06715 [Puccinia striiformis]|uniref:Uncharacterized protein n=1 Tax=Puccinia striiformis TaxID=27350 RepID=A0A2S4W4Q6_9BASI|nr:hypothetical protein PSHT_06715 [Puccinia striiformis]
MFISARIKTRIREREGSSRVVEYEAKRAQAYQQTESKSSSSNDAGTSTKNHWLVIAHTSRPKTLIKRVGVLDQSKAIAAD